MDFMMNEIKIVILNLLKIYIYLCLLEINIRNVLNLILLKYKYMSEIRETERRVCKGLNKNSIRISLIILYL